MSESLSAEQVRARHIATMGQPLGEQFNLLSNELTWLFWRWQEYVALYATKETRLEIINRSAPFFFWVIQESLWYDTLLGIARLAGAPATGKKQNLSLERLLPLVKDPQLRVTVDTRLQQMRDKAQFAFDWRNRHIAHRDLDLALKQAAVPLPEASRAAVDAALDALAEVLNAIDSHFSHSTTAYRFSTSPWGAQHLLFVLRDGLRREELRQKRLEEGQYNPEEWDDDAPAI